MEKYTSSHYSSGKCAGKQFYGVTFSYTAPAVNYRPANSNANIVPPPIYKGIEINRPKKKGSRRGKKKRRILALPALFPRGILGLRSPPVVRTNRNRDTVNICMLGQSGVGKSPFVIQFVQNHYVDEYDPTIEDSYRKQIMYEDRPLLLDILDTCGLEEFSALRDQWLRSAEAFIICFACDRLESIDEITVLSEQIARVKDQKIQQIPIVLAGTKYDLEDQHVFNPDDMQRLADDLNASLIYTSARYNINITETFRKTARLALERRYAAVPANT